MEIGLVIIAILSLVLNVVRVQQSKHMLELAYASKEAQVVTVEVPVTVVDYEELSKAVTSSLPKSRFDYEKLSKAIAEAISENPPTIVASPAVLPAEPPGWWQTPIVSDGNVNTFDDGHTITINTDAEINGYRVRQFPGSVT